MPKPAIPKLGTSTFRGWTFVLICGVVLAVIAMIDRGGLSGATATADGSTGCRLEVTTDQLNVRASPSQNAELLRVYTRGDVVDGTAVVTDGYRELEGGSWAVTDFLVPEPGSTCT